MYLDPTDFYDLTVTLVSDDTSDSDAVLYASATIATFPLPYEGSLVFNFTTVDNTYTNEAGWPTDLGFSLANNDFKNIPCTVLLNDNLIGRGSNSHPNVRCYVFSSNTDNNGNALIQIRGFSSQLSIPSDPALAANAPNIKVYIPNV
jgi:hypothetical protein